MRYTYIKPFKAIKPEHPCCWDLMIVDNDNFPIIECDEQNKEKLLEFLNSEQFNPNIND